MFPLQKRLRSDTDRRITIVTPARYTRKEMPFMQSEGGRQQSGIVVTRLGREYGSMNISAIAEFDRSLSKDLDDTSFALLIDWERTVYIGCELLNALLTWHARLKPRRCKIAVCGLQGLPQSILALTHLDSLWEVFPTRGEAIESLRRQMDNTEVCDSVCAGGNVRRNAT